MYTHHSSGEVWYLRLLLSKVRGPISFKALRTVNGVEYSTFQDACNEYHLLDNDDEWHEVMSECSKCGFPPQIRQLFVHIIVNSQVSNLSTLWKTHSKEMSEDVLFMKRRVLKKPDLLLKETEIEYYALAGMFHINQLL